MKNFGIAATLAVIFLSPSTASAAPILATELDSNFARFTFSGEVAIDRPEQLSLRNPDGSTTSISGSDVPAYRYNVGDSLQTSFTFATQQSQLQNASCGGRFTFKFAAQGLGACDLELGQATTPFGNVGLGGTGGDAQPTVTGLDVLYDAANGTFALDMPTGSYSMRYVGVNPYYYDSQTGTLSGPNANRCVDTFNCPNSIFSGTTNAISFGNIPIAGDFGQNAGGFAVGYNAGSASVFSLIGDFFGGGSSGGGPVEVPEPPMVAMLAAAFAALVARRRQIKI